MDRKPPKDVQDAYRNGLKRHEDGETGDGLEPITVQMARKFANGEATTIEWARKGNRWWGRNARFAKAEPGTPAYASAQLWGGRNWFAPIVKAADREDGAIGKLVTLVEGWAREVFMNPTVRDAHIPTTETAKASKADVNYRRADAGGCDTCASQTDGGCRIVEGGGASGYTCDRHQSSYGDFQMDEYFLIPIEKGTLNDVLIFPIGPFQRDGRAREFTTEMAREMVANFEADVIGRQPPVNREHMREHGRIGRITGLRLASDGVRGDIEEADGYDGAMKAFDYLSPEVRWEWTNPYTGETHRNVLFGAGATRQHVLINRVPGGTPLHKLEAQ